MKTPTDYPANYKRLFLRALQSPVTLTFESPSEATTMRSQLYLYRSAVGRDKDLRVFSKQIEVLSFHISGHKLTVTRKEGYGESVIRQALHSVPENQT